MLDNESPGCEWLGCWWVGCQWLGRFRLVAGISAFKALQQVFLVVAHMHWPAVDAETTQDSYPVEYDPLDRPVEEVVMQLVDDTPPVIPPPAEIIQEKA